MWKRRIEIAALALLIVLAGSGSRPHVHIDAPGVDLASVMPQRIDSLADVGMVTLSIAASLLD